MNVAIIPARGGSRRIPRKNFRAFHGKPILAYSVEAALASGLFDGGVWVSAEEADWGEIGIAAPGAGWIRRVPGHALDDVGTQEVTRQALLTMQRERERESEAIALDCVVRPLPKYTCCIYATAPLLKPFDLCLGREALIGYPYAYVPGLYYWGRTEAFLAGVPLSEGFQVAFPAERYIDINTPEDWSRAEQMYLDLRGAVMPTADACLNGEF